MIHNLVYLLLLPSLDEPDDLIISCSHELSPNGLSYIVHMFVQITPYIANEEVIDKISVIPDLIEYDSNTGNVIDQDAGALVDFNIEVRNLCLMLSYLIAFLLSLMTRIIILY